MENDDELLRRVVQARLGGKVERAHGIPHLGSYSNAAHSWGVAMLMLQLWPEDFPRLAGACLCHDVPEAWTGDVPAPTGRYVPGLKDGLGALEQRIFRNLNLPSERELNPEDYTKLKACDSLELWLWCTDQRLAGNLFVEETRQELERYYQESPLPDRAQRFYENARDGDRLRLLPKQAGVIKELVEEQEQEVPF